MRKSWIVGLATASLALAAGAAHAGGVNWSIGINLPPVGTVISSGPQYPVYPAYPVYAPPPVVYRPAPVYYAPPPVVYRPAPVYYGPPAVVVERRWRGGWEHGHHGGWRERGPREDRYYRP